MAWSCQKLNQKNNMIRFRYIAAAFVCTAFLAAGCSGVNLKQFDQPRNTAKIISTTSFHPLESNPAECGEAYDENDTYPNVTEYQDEYGNTLVQKWFHPDGEAYMYSRYYYTNASAGDLDKVVQYEPPKEPKVAMFVRDSNGAVVEISETIIFPDRTFVKTESKREGFKETAVYEDRSTVSSKTPLDGNKLQVEYRTVRTDSISETGSKVYDQNTGKLTQHSGTKYEKGSVKMEFGKQYEYTPDGKISRIINHQGASTSYYLWEYDDHGNWISYKYYKEPDDGKGEYTQVKEYSYNEQGEWTKCVTSTCGKPEAIVIREIEYIDK